MDERLDRGHGIKDLTRNLRDVVLVDYFATHKLIRGTLNPNFDKEKYDFDIKHAYKWINENQVSLSVLSSRRLPDYVKDYRFTIGLYLELKDEVAKNNTIYSEPVAFSLSSRELREDVESVKNGLKENGLMNVDLMSFVVFLKYWRELESRARILEVERTVHRIS